MSRAKQHAGEFNSLEQNFLQHECSGIVTEVDPVSESNIIKIKFFKAVPLEIASVVSDAANNLRDSLDHMGYATAQSSKKGGSSGESVGNWRAQR